MKKLRVSFWDKSKNLIGWCDDEELRVLRQQAGKELENRLKVLTDSFDASEQVRAGDKRAMDKHRSRKVSKNG